MSIVEQASWCQDGWLVTEDGRLSLRMGHVGDAPSGVSEFSEPSTGRVLMGGSAALNVDSYFFIAVNACKLLCSPSSIL